MADASFSDNAIFWVELEKIHPNPYQPRKEFSEEALNDLAESLRQYGVLQPLTVTRKEIETEDGLHSEYELIAGERRLRAAKIGGLSLVPVIIRSAQQDEREKLELAIIENLQREDLNPIDRAQAFNKLAEEFKFKHSQIAKKVGKSREYISNSLRLLSLPEDMRAAMASGDISEGHARPLMMLSDKPEEQKTLFKEILYKKLTTREAERISRKIAHEKTRKKSPKPDPETQQLEGQLSEKLGTRVSIEQQEQGGRIVINYFTNDDLRMIADLLERSQSESATAMLERFMQQQQQGEAADAPAASATQGEGAQGGTIQHDASADGQPAQPQPVYASADAAADAQAAWQSPAESVQSAAVGNAASPAGHTDGHTEAPNSHERSASHEYAAPERHEQEASTESNHDAPAASSDTREHHQRNDEDDDLYAVRNFSI